LKREPASLSHRWYIAGLVTIAIAISYLDRQTLPVAVDAIRQDFPISDKDYGRLVSVFLFAYALMYMGGGKLIDVLGTRRGFFVIMVGWSLACASHGLANGILFLAVCRFLLGLGEGGGFPAATKAVAEWFPARERSTAMGMINAGTAVGAVLAAPAVAAIITVSNWRWAFFAAGAAGLVWTVWWMREYFPPAEHPRLSSHERDEIQEVLVASRRPASEARWLDLLALPQVWGLVLAKCLSDAAWFFYAQWLPKYLYDVHHFVIKDVGYYGWIPYAASGVGSLAGGAFSSWLLQRGNSLNFARKVALGLSAACMPWVFLVTRLPAEAAIVLFSIAFFGQQSWSTLVMTLPADIFPRRLVGSVAGLVGFGGAMGGVVFNLVAGNLLDSLGRDSGYVIVFALSSSFHILAFMLILATVRRVEPVDI
jgi:ACS family hexuronate transporter-like MFS transporter